MNILYVYGGLGYGSSYDVGALNDLWIFHLPSKQWLWAQGSHNSLNEQPSIVNGNQYPGSRVGAGLALKNGEQSPYVILIGGAGKSLNQDLFIGIHLLIYFV